MAASTFASGSESGRARIGRRTARAARAARCPNRSLPDSGPGPAGNRPCCATPWRARRRPAHAVRANAGVVLERYAWVRLPIAKSSRSSRYCNRPRPINRQISASEPRFCTACASSVTLSAAAMSGLVVDILRIQGQQHDAHRIGVVGGKFQPLEDGVAGLGFQLEDAVGLRLHAIQRGERCGLGCGARRVRSSEAPQPSSERRIGVLVDQCLQCPDGRIRIGQTGGRGRLERPAPMTATAGREYPLFPLGKHAGPHT